MENDHIILQSLGAAQTVTGSKHLLKTPEGNFLIDCGLFQGLKELRTKNREDFPIDVSSIDAMILTHAHLDHCGYIPLLVKKGFRGRIYMTLPTNDLARMILRDSAKIQEEDAFLANKFHYSKHKPALPLYTMEDAEASFALFVPVEHSTVINLSGNISFEFRKSGHILGAASVVLNCFEKAIVFSGDIGRYQSSFLLPPASLPKASIVVMESTYGDRLHGEQDPLDQLADIINEALPKNGSVLIPSFAVGRAQEIMHLINQLKKSNRIPSALPVFLDSPMAADATDILCRYPKWHKLSHTECLSVCKDVIINRDWHETQHIIRKPGSKIIISASGMITGGRILEYMKHLGSIPNNTILLIGYQAEGTRGRDLQNKVNELKIHGKYYSIKANVVEISGLSAHADQKELLHWLGQFDQYKPKIILVHGEGPAQAALEIKIRSEHKLDVKIANQNEEIILSNVKINHSGPSNAHITV